MAKAVATTSVERTSEGLRDALFDTIDKLRAGEITPENAIAASKVACQIINSVRIEVEYLQIVERNATSSREAPVIGQLRLGKSDVTPRGGVSGAANNTM